MRAYETNFSVVERLRNERVPRVRPIPRLLLTIIKQIIKKSCISHIILKDHAEFTQEWKKFSNWTMLV